MRFALRAKLFALTTTVVMLTTATATWVFSVRQVRERRVAVEAEVERVAKNLAALRFDGHDWADYRRYVGQLIEFNRDIVYIAIYDDRDALRAHALNSRLVDLPDEHLDRRAEAEIVSRLDRGEVAPESRDDLQTHRVGIAVGDRIFGSVHVGFSLIEVNRELSRGVMRHASIGVAFVLFSGMLSFYLSRHLTGPLERLSGAMERLAAGDLEQRVRVESRDEIGQLATTFNDMAGDLRERQIIDRLGRTLSSTFQLERLVELVREHLAGAIGACSTRLYLRRAADGSHFTTVETDDGAVRSLTVEADCREALLRCHEGVRIADAPEEVRRACEQLPLRAGDLLMPMQVKGELLGLLLFEPPEDRAGRFDPKQQRLAHTLVGQAALALENALLYEELREQERMRGELALARAVQRKLLPREPPRLPGIDLDGYCRPANEIGGDYYDFIRIDETHLGIVIADVSGKGASAALYMAEIKGMVLSLVAHAHSPSALVAELNRTLFPSLERSVFASVLYGVLDVTSGRLDYVRAGHPPLIHVCGDGRVDAPAPSGMAVGLDAGELFESTLESATLTLLPGELLVLLTDGVTEAMNVEREPFGMDRLFEAVAAAAGHDPVKLRTCVLESVERFVGQAPQFDDMTLLALRYIGTEPSIDPTRRRQ